MQNSIVTIEQIATYPNGTKLQNNKTGKIYVISTCWTLMHLPSINDYIYVSNDEETIKLKIKDLHEWINI
jgi:hypothetical protein